MKASLRIPNPLATLERKARGAIKDWPESARLNEESDEVKRLLATGKISTGQARELRKLTRLRRARLVMKHVYHQMRGEVLERF